MANSTLDAHLSVVLLWIQEGFTHQEMVERFTQLGVKTSEASIRRCIDRNDSLKEAWETRLADAEVNRLKDRGAEREGAEESENEQTITSFVATNKALSVEDMLRIYKVDTEEWEVKDWKINSWPGPIGDGMVTRYFQTTVFLCRKLPIRILLPAIEPLSKTYKVARIDPTKPIFTVVETDAHCPFVNPELNALAIKFIEELQPDRHIVGGDLLNNGYIGRHRDNPKWDDSVNEAVQSGFEYLYARREVAPDMEMWLIPGNHDDRIRNEQLERNERLYGVTQAHYPDEEPGVRLYSLGHLLRLSELGVNYSEPEGTYEFEYIEITPLLAVRHGHKTSKGAAMKTANELGHSVVLGHTHRQSATCELIWNKIEGTWQQRWAIEAGTLGVHEDGGGYNRAGAPDWQPGFVTVTSWPDGQFTFDFAQYTQQGELLWRDKRFTL